MSRSSFVLAGLSIATAFGANAPVAKPTYTKHIAPILNQRCVECHRPGEAAPMMFTSYKEVRPWAKAIKEKVVARTMPPWLADPAHGVFKNDRRLSETEVATIVNWVNAGSPEGNVKDLPPSPEFVTGWTIGKPDVVIDMGREYTVPAEGTIPYQHFTVDPGIKEDVWVQAVEARPDKRDVVHHIIVYILPPGTPESAARGEQAERRGMLVGYAPGDPATIFEPGTARLIKAGSKFVFQMHYTASGKERVDRSYFGFKYATVPPKYHARITVAGNNFFKIPPGDPNHEVKSKYEVKQDMQVISFMPHMHVRGKDWLYKAVFPDGREQILLSVPKYDFNWQLTYELKEPLLLPKGSRIECVAHFDNSPNNKYNPDPTKEVRFGPQTWEEMMLGWFTYITPVDPRTVNPAIGGQE